MTRHIPLSTEATAAVAADPGLAPAPRPAGGSKPPTQRRARSIGPRRPHLPRQARWSDDGARSGESWGHQKELGRGRVAIRSAAERRTAVPVRPRPSGEVVVARDWLAGTECGLLGTLREGVADTTHATDTEADAGVVDRTALVAEVVVAHNSGRASSQGLVGHSCLSKVSPNIHRDIVK